MISLHAASRFSLVTCLILAGGCSEAPTESLDLPQHVTTIGAPIMGGYNDNSTLSVVGIVRLSNWGGVGICSGTLIAPNVVLTAQHCVAPINNSAANGGVQCGVSNFGSPYSADQLYISTDNELSQWGDWVPAKAIHVVPGDGDVCGQDIAVMVLQGSVPSSVATPRVPRVDQKVQVPNGIGEVYSAVGYGNINDDYGSGRRRRRDALAATCVGSQCGFWTSVQSSEWMGQAGVCQGDSGGPALDAVGRVIGVASRGGSGCSSPVYGGVWEWSDWLMTHVKDATEAAGIETPGWALGFTTDPLYSHPVGQACSDGVECSSGMCETGFCTRRCIADAPCPEGWSCSADNGICRPAPVGQLCTDDSQCESGSCEKGRCTRFCDAVIGCPAGYGCNVADWCELYPVGAACSDDDACPSKACVDGTCTRACDANAPCPAPYGCDPGTGQCAMIPVSAECTTDAECAGGTCQNGACTRECSSEQPCPMTHTCTDGLCEPLPIGGGCTSDAECGDGTCQDGACTSGCASNDDCLTGYVCAAGTCTLIEVGGECSDDSACADGQCVDDACTRTCSLQAPCPGGYLCDPSQNVCIEAPVSGALPGSGCTSAPTGPRSALPFALVLLGMLGLAHRWRRAR